MSFPFLSYYNLLIFTSIFACIMGLKSSSIERTFQKGVQAYSGEQWSECILQFEESLHLYKLYKSMIVNCRLKCNSQEYNSDIKENIEDLKFYEKFFNVRDCLINCQEQEFENLRMQSDLTNSMIHNMQIRKPYEYLHVCYFQMNALPKAASAAYTYLIANPDNEEMKNNLNYYVQQPEVDSNEVVDLLSEDYMVLFHLGLQAYKQNNWGETIVSMEEVLTDYLLWENSCRVECERQPEQEWSPEFVITVSNNIASLLHCRQQCQDKLKLLGYNSGVEFLADVLNYIQISYYKMDRIKDAAKAVSSYLALMPHDEDMLHNKNIYSSLTDEEAFTERSDILYYYKRDSYEKKLLIFFHNGGGNNVDSNAI